MIAAATAAATAAPPAGGGFPVNWFDVLLVVMLAVGIYRGHRNGMSKELLPLLEWLILVPLCGLVYPTVGGFLNSFITDALWSDVIAYVGLALLVLLVFKILKDLLAEKLVKSDFFKGGEYYFGMGAGMVRYACVLIVALALLNAPVYSSAEIAQMTAYDEKNFGGGLFAGNYFPHIYQVQDSVFKNSLIGPHLKDCLGPLLIATGEPVEAKPVEKAAPPKPRPVIIIGNPTTNPPASAK